LKASRDTILTLATFFIFIVLFYGIGYWLIFRLGQATPLMLSVGIATIFTCVVRKRSLASLGWGWGEWRYQWLSYLVPFIIVFSAYFLIWSSDFGNFYNNEFLLKQKEKYNLNNWSNLGIFIFHFILVVSISFIISLPSVLGEELGWRGFLVPELSKFLPFSGVALVSGLIWSLWHWPLILNGLYGNSVTPIYYQLCIFTIFIVSNSVTMAYLRLKSNSLWTAVIFHASSNMLIQKIFTPITLANSKSVWFIDEFGIITAFAAFCVAIYFWRAASTELKNSKA